MTMTARTPDFTPAARAGIAAGFAAAVFASALLAVQLPAFGASVFPVWFPAGLMLYASGRFGWAGTVGGGIGSLAFNCLITPWWVATGIAFGATLSYAHGARQLAKCGFRGGVDDLTQTRRFILLGVAFAPVASAINGPLWLVAGGLLPPADAWRAALLWWGGDAVGVIAIVPALYLVPRRAAHMIRTPGAISANLASILAVSAVSAVVFLPGSPVAEHRLPVAFLPVLALSVVSFLTPSCVAALSVLATAALGVVGTALRAGPFSEYGPQTGAVLIGLFTGTVGIVTLLVLGARGSQARTSAELAASAREYRLLVDGSPTLICRYRPDGTVTFANDTLRRFAGDDLTRLNLPLVMPAEDVEVECPAADGERRWVRWTAHEAGPDGTGQPHFQAVGVDVTARRQAEEERRTIEQRMYQTARLESLGVIAGGVAHDFNNILTGILGNVSMAANDLPPGSPLATFLTRAGDAAIRAADLNGQLLAYAGKGKFVIRPINLNDLIAQTAELVRLSLSKKVEVKLERWPNLPLVKGDASQLQQVLMNLLINAGDAIGDRPGTVTIRTDTTTAGDSELTDASTGRPSRPGQYVTVSVSDTGCGMDEATKAKIFEPFFTTKFTGRGLGLAAVQGIVRGHKGVLGLETAVGAGTTFTVFLPEFVPPSADPEPLPPTETPEPLRVSPAPSSRRLVALVVDDEDAVRELTGEVLRQIGWSVVSATNGREAVDAFHREPDAFAFAVLDLTMPVMDGLEAMAALRARRPRLPVLLCTGYAADTIPPTESNAPTGILLKPFRPIELQEALADLFGSADSPTPIP